MSTSENYQIIQIIIIFTVAFLGAITNQIKIKFGLFAKYKSEKKIFKRWSNEDDDMVTADRIVANLVEWGIIFWPLFFGCILVHGSTGNHIIAGYVYVIARLIYVLLGCAVTFKNHITNLKVLVATIPAYGALIYLIVILLPEMIKQD